MLNISELEIGKHFFRVYISNDTFRRDKIRMTDSDGIEWYRYDAPRYSYIVSEYTLCGFARIKTAGEVREEYSDENIFFFKHSITGDLDEYAEYEIMSNEWFMNKDDADIFGKATIKEMEEKYG